MNDEGQCEFPGMDVDEWKGMPEFKHQKLEPWASMLVHFKSQEDRAKFAELIEQNITNDTQSLWYPKAEIETYMDKRYESDES